MMQSSPARRVAYAVLALSIAATATISCDAREPNGVQGADGSLSDANLIRVEPRAGTVVLDGTSLDLTATVRDGFGEKINGGVRWVSLAPEIATIDANGRVSGVSLGEAIVTATHGVIADTAIVSVVGGPGATPARVLVEPRVATVGAGETLQLDAIVIDEHGLEIPGVPVRWSNADPGATSLHANGLVRGDELGRSRIIVGVGGLRDTAWVRVRAAGLPVRVQVQPRADTISTAAEDVALFAQVRDTAGGLLPGATVKWESLNPAVAMVSDEGTVTAGAGGMARIVANYGVVADTVDVFVIAWQFPAAVTVEPKSDTIAQIGGTLDLEAEILDQTGAIMSQTYARWVSLDPQIVSVEWRTGLVTAYAAGIARVLVRAGNARDTAFIWVAPAAVTAVPTSLRITPSTDTLTAAGQTVVLVGEVLDGQGSPIPGGALTWTAAHPGIASVDAAGMVTAIANGTARIIATSQELADTASIVVAIDDDEEDDPGTGASTRAVVITPGSDTLAVGATVTLMAEVRDAQGNRVSDAYVHWRSLDASAEVGAPETAVLTGLTVTGVVPGLARIIAVHESDADTAEILVTGGQTGASRNVRIDQPVDTIPTVGGSVQLTAAVVDQSGNVVGTQGIAWASLDAAIATVSSSGLVRGVARGVARVTATYQATSDTAFVWVAPAAGGGPPPTGFTVASAIVGFKGTGTVLVSNGIPLPAGTLFPGDTRKITVLVGGAEQSLHVEPLAGRHPDGSVRSMLVQFRYPVAAGQTIPAQIVMGPSVDRQTADIPPTAPVYGYGSPLPQAALLPSSPDYLIGTGIVGVTVPVGASFNAEYESNFVSVGDAKWAIMQSEYGTSLLDGNKVSTYNYYDRALANFAWWARTGDPRYWKRGIMYELAYRDVYLRLYDYRVQPHNIHIEGLELQYLLTGDPESLRGVRLAADYYFTTWLPEIGNAQAHYTDNRIQARTLDGFVTAARLGITTRDFAGAARQALTKILGTQRTDGSYRFAVSCDTQYSFMTGLVNDAMIKYYEYMDHDVRIITAMKKSLDFMWTTQWIASAGAFQYATGTCPGVAGTNAAPDLNLLIVNGYGWYSSVTGDTSYDQIGDLVFNEGVAKAWLGNTPAQADKQFNQQYRSAYRYLSYRR